MTTTTLPVITAFNTEVRPSEEHYLYGVYTVSTWRITGQTAVWAVSAEAAVEYFIRKGYVKASAYPYAEGKTDKPVKHGDTHLIDIRKQA